MHKTNKMSSNNPCIFSMSLCQTFGESGLLAAAGPVMSRLEHSGHEEGPTYTHKHNDFAKGHKNIKIFKKEQNSKMTETA